MRLTNKVALVTGGSCGIGQAICRRLVADCAQVALVDILDQEARKTVDEIKNKGGQAMAVRCDVTQFDQVQVCVQTIADAWGQVDILVNNAGWDKIEPFI